jgi:hypothetical protein
MRTDKGTVYNATLGIPLSQNIALKVHNRNMKEAFTNEEGAIDLASIMVGIIVIGLIGGVIAATVFAVIPWAQDNAAKQQLDAVVTAQSAKAGMDDGKYSTDLGSFLDTSSTKVGLRSNGSDCYGAFVTSASGNSFYVSSAKTQPVKIAANAAWPAKPAGYPVNCSWPAGPEAAGIPASTNFVTNPSVETASTGHIQHIGRTPPGGSRVQSATAHSGEYVWRSVTTASGESVGYGALSTGLEPGEYVMSAKIRSADAIKVRPYMEYGSGVTDTNLDISKRVDSPDINLSNNWQTVAIKVTVVKPGTVLKMGYLQSAVGVQGQTVDLDSFQVVKSTGDMTKDSVYLGG